MLRSRLFKNRSKRGFDEETGQVYTETTCPEPTIPRSIWQTSPPRQRLPRIFKNNRGAASLVSTALRVIVRNSRCLTADLLRHVPWTVGVMIWKEIQFYGLVTFDTWAAFASVYADAGVDSIQYRRLVASQPCLPLENYINPSMCEAVEWITLLSIQSANLTQVEVVNLAGLKNLVGLDIIADSTNPLEGVVQDSVIRSWSRSVKDDGAFSRLRVLGLRGWEAVTVKSIAYLSNFPALVFFDVRHTSITEAEFISSDIRGWVCQSGHVLDGTLSRRFREASRTLAHRHGSPPEPETLPVLYVSVGVGGGVRDRGEPLFFQRMEEVIIGDRASPEPQSQEDEQVGSKRKNQSQKAARKQIRLSKRQSVDKILGDFARNLTRHRLRQNRST